MEHSGAATVFFSTARGAVCPSLRRQPFNLWWVQPVRGFISTRLGQRWISVAENVPGSLFLVASRCVCIRRRRRSGAQWVGVGLLQAERAVVRERVVVVVFDQSWQGGEGHFTVQENVVLLPKWMAHVTFASFAWFEHTDNLTLFIYSQNSMENSWFLTSWNNL